MIHVFQATTFQTVFEVKTPRVEGKPKTTDFIGTFPVGVTE